MVTLLQRVLWFNMWYTKSLSCIANIVHNMDGRLKRVGVLAEKGTRVGPLARGKWARGQTGWL